MRSTLAILTAILAGCTPPHDSRLTGSWVSDLQATVSHNRSIAPQMDWQKYSQLFGRMRVTYDDEGVATELNGVVERSPLHVVRRDADTVTLKIHDRLDKEDRLLVVHFVGPEMYWIHIRDTEHREYFRRVRQSEK